MGVSLVLSPLSQKLPICWLIFLTLTTNKPCLPHYQLMFYWLCDWVEESIKSFEKMTKNSGSGCCYWPFIQVLCWNGAWKPPQVICIVLKPCKHVYSNIITTADINIVHLNAEKKTTCEYDITFKMYKHHWNRRNL